MATLLTFLIVYLLLSVAAGVVVLCASMRSSQLSRMEEALEEMLYTEENRPVTAHLQKETRTNRTVERELSTVLA